MTPTMQAALKERQQLAEKDAENALTVPKSGAVAVPDNRTAQDRWLDTVAPVTTPGRTIKFTKGEFTYADTGEKVPEGAVYKALCDQTLISWLRFRGPGVSPDKIAGLLYSDFELPPRSALGDDDPAQWEIGLDGKPVDPWTHQVALVLENGESGELFTFLTASITGRKAAGNLLRHFNQMEKRKENAYPLVQLRKGAFTHSDPRVGTRTNRYADQAPTGTPPLHARGVPASSLARNALARRQFYQLGTS